MPVTGLKEISDELKKLPRDLRGKTLDKAVGKAARLVRDRAKNTYVPVHSGRLRESIAAVKDRKLSSHENSVYNVGFRKKKAWYGGLVELGTSKTGAQPFMRPALDTEQDNALSVMATIFRKALKL